ncbi:tyrosine-protein phosphatase [Paenibacillus sp. yr247]|uniref:tyrosine-protein phosphatase n=1 Tax=Paenibacillus sp. yr247 TaxID=1761880 RepID=UPI001C31D378|nr:CpsB/CapC family capsule biosynthesis tyrosine phosphatase [Paenibacillus sp. yr247]
MIDTHCHILPCMDDGAESMEEAIVMARYALQCGINALVATPHHANGRYENDAIKIKNAVNIFKGELKQQGINLIVHAGQEVRVNKYVMDDLMSGKILTLNESQYILLELPSKGIPSYFDELLHELRVIHLTPVIAHPERNAEFLKYPSRLREYVESGVICQATSHSLSGVFGNKIKKFAFELCKQNLIHVIGSDAHNTSTRQGNLGQVLSDIRAVLGEERAQYYLENAALLIKGEAIINQSFNRKKRKWLNIRNGSFYRQKWLNH